MYKFWSFLIAAVAAAAHIDLQDVTVTKTISNTRYVCPCEISGASTIWQQWSPSSSATSKTLTDNLGGWAEWSSVDSSTFPQSLNTKSWIATSTTPSTTSSTTSLITLSTKLSITPSTTLSTPTTEATTEAATTEATTELATTEATTKPATTEPATTEATTEATTTAATTEPVTTESATTEATTEPATTEVTAEPATTEPATTEPATTEPATTEPATTEPATTEATTERATTEPATTEATTEPATTEATTEPATTEPATTEATTEPATTSTLTTTTVTSSCPQATSFILTAYNNPSVPEGSVASVQGSAGESQYVEFNTGEAASTFYFDSRCNLVIASDDQIANIDAGSTNSPLFFNTQDQITGNSAQQCVCGVTGTNNQLTCQCGSATIFSLDSAGDLYISDSPVDGNNGVDIQLVFQ